MQNRAEIFEERLEKLGEAIIDVVKHAPKDISTISLLEQLIRSGTSIGANYMEANGSSSRKDFKNKIHICKKEAKETMHWLRMLSYAANNDIISEQCRKLWQESKECAKIFSSIISTLKNKKY